MDTRIDLINLNSIRVKSVTVHAKCIRLNILNFNKYKRKEAIRILY